MQAPLCDLVTSPSPEQEAALLVTRDHKDVPDTER